MYAVGKLGSYISQGVYTVSGPFHPFGGAVDIIVVQQEDGTFKSSPWHVKFGKFQGVLKTREKVVNICVDGVDAGFHMYLNHKGEAYFLRDSDDDDDVVEKIASPRLEKAMSPRLEPAASSRRSRIFGLMFGGRSMKKEGVGAERMDSLERAEIAADLLDMKWETDLAFGKRRDDVPGERTEDTVGGFETSSTGKEKCEEVTVVDSPRIPADVIDVHLQEPIDIHMNNDDSDDALFGSVGEKGDGFGTNMVREVHSDVIDVDLQEPTAKDICLNNDDSDDALFGSVGEKGDGLGTNMAREVHSDVIDVDLQEPTAKDICLNNDDSDDALFGSVVEKGDGLGTNMAREVHSDVIDVDLQEPIAKDICMNNDDSNDALLGSGGEKGDGLGTNMVRDVHSEEAAHEEVSEPVLIESDECNISSERSVPSNSTSDLQCSCSVPFPGGQEEAALERVGSSTVNCDVTSDQTDKDLNISFEGSRPTENPSEVLCESSVQMPDVKPKMDPDECTGEKNCDAFVYQDLGIAEVEGYSVFQNAHADSPRYPSAIANGSSAESPLSSCFTESHVICEGKPADDAPQEKETINEVMKVIEDQSPTNTESSGSNLDYPVTDEIFSISDDEAQDSKELKNRSNVEISIADTMKDEVFHFTDTDSFAVKETGPQEPHKDAIVEPDVSVLVTDCDAAQHQLEDESSEGSLECVPEVPGSQTSPMSIPRRKTHLEDGKLLAKSLPLMHSQIHGIETSNLLHLLSCSLDSNFEEYAEDLLKEKISLSSKLETNYEVNMLQDNHIPETVASAAEIEQGQEVTTISPLVELSRCKNLLCEGVGDDAASGVFSVEKGVENHSIDPSRATVLSEESWKLWPFSFKRSKSISTVRSLPETINMENVDIALSRSQTVTAVDKVRSAKFIKKKVRSLTPTSEELASLNLKEGRNVLTFSFSTAMLGQQQVDARIYLWKWNTRIVISDVDGTITKSDVLGQFMPLVGLDWYQTGVVHLFSAIKENGYQMLFLSARSISQAYLTRQFLLNLRQDGKSLPDGPVVISPDGLFPSLYREVIRRVPHEFKISCLEDIRALFPPECNPFYAGFGNRDTDEISYLKVGIPKGKIFIVNPKGEIAMSRRVDGKSYISLHALVHGMFPPVSSAEQEDFNSWNYWKLPLPDIDN